MTSTTALKNKWVPWFLLVLLVAMLQRAVLWLTYPPATYHDTGGYRRLAGTILGGWKFYDGTRVPGYPQWMVWFGSDTQVYLSQLFLGLAITLIFFFIGWQVTRSPIFPLQVPAGACAALAALAHTLNLGQLFFETDLLSETLATFWLLLALACVGLALQWKGKRLAWAWLGAGLFSALAGMTRTLYLFMPFWIGLFLALAQQSAPIIQKTLSGRPQLHLRAIHFNWRPLLIVSLPAILIIGLWINFLYQHYRILSVTTMGGFNLVQHTGQWFELLPDEDAVLRDIFLKYRAIQLSNTGTTGNTIWEALPAMQKATGLGFYQLSDVMIRLSFKLIWQHPDLYLRSALDGWQLFWRAPVYWEPQAIPSAAVRSGLEALVTGERLLLMAANLAFMLTSLLALVSRRWRARLGVTPWWAFILLTLWLTSILQTLPDHGDNPRFLAPQQSWVVLWILWVILKVWTSWRAQKAAPPIAMAS